jgi:serine/threonine-protein kinase
MIISYCVHPQCSNPKNHPKFKKCNTCGSNLILNERYRVIKLLGRGGFGTTFMGVDLTVVGDPLCVVKQLRPATEGKQAFPMALSLFEREAKTLRKISHPQIPKLIDYFADGEHFYLIQELVNGQNLQKEIKLNGVYGELAVKRFLDEITPVVKYIHSEKVIHRDIKPANILKQKKDGKLILIDFGAVKDQVNSQLAKTLGDTALTRFAVGTMGYAPPEQLAMRPIYSSDIYALGATCVYLLTGKSPKNFERNPHTGELLWQKEVVINSELAKIITKMLNPDPRQRFKTADELLEALELSPFQLSLSQNLIRRQVYTTSVLDYDNTITDVTQTGQTYSQLTNSTSVTQKLAKAVKQRQQKIAGGKGANNLGIKWTQETFLTAYRSGKKDFSEQDLSNLNLEGIKLPKFIFRYSKLQGATLLSANLSQTNFYGANLVNANLKEAKLIQAYFAKTNLQNADLKGANLTGADLTNANLQDADLCGANLRNAKLNQKQLQSAKVNWTTIFPDGSRRWWKMF